jgi:hypothetical protein
VGATVNPIAADNEFQPEIKILQRFAAAPDCKGAYNPATVQERGHTAKSNKGAHLAYNADGEYVKAAACFVLQQWNKSHGS